MHAAYSFFKKIKKRKKNLSIEKAEKGFCILDYHVDNHLLYDVVLSVRLSCRLEKKYKPRISGIGIVTKIVTGSQCVDRWLKVLSQCIKTWR
jgi:hypothetical protein